MKGLFVKDLKLMMLQKNFLLLILAIVIGMMIFTDDVIFPLGFLSFIVSLFTVSTISYDDFDNGNAFLFTLPITRNHYVSEKYFLGLLLGCMAWVLATVLGIITTVLKDTLPITDLVQSSLMILPIMIVVQAIMLPFQLKFGGDKGRIAMIGAFGGLAVITLVIVKGAEAIFNIDLVSLLDNMPTVSMGVDYLRVRFPTTDALEIIKNVLAMKSEYFIHEDYGMFGYEEQYIYGDISVNASKDSSMGVLLELRGMGCRNLEYVLQARGIDWYYFLSSCIDYQGVFKRIDLAVNDMGGLLDIEILRERYYANKVWKRSRTHEAVDSGKLSGTHGDTAKTFYIGSKNSSIYFCLYEKEKEQKSKGIKTDIKNRFEIRLKSGKAEQTIEQLVFSRNPEQTIASLILTQIDFPVYILWDIFLDNVTTSLPFIMTPVAVNMDKTKRWLERQVMPSLLMIKEIEKQTGANYLEEIDRHTRLTEKQELKIKQMTTDIADMIEKDTAVPQGNDGIF